MPATKATEQFLRRLDTMYVLLRESLAELHSQGHDSAHGSRLALIERLETFLGKDRLRSKE